MGFALIRLAEPTEPRFYVHTHQFLKLGGGARFVINL